MSLILDRMVSFVEQDSILTEKYIVTKVKSVEILRDGETMSVEEVRDIINNTDYVVLNSLPKLEERRD